MAARLGDSPGFGRFWSAASVSAFGTYVTSLAIQVLVVKTLHGGSTQVGLVNAARWFPYLLLGVVTGVIVDRLRRLPLLVATDLVRGGLLIAIPVLALTHHLHVAVLMVFMAVFGLLSLVNEAAAQSFVPRLVPVALLPHANARFDQSDAVAQTSGPALAGAIVSVVGAPFAVIVDAVSYVVSGLLLSTVTAEEPPRRPLTRAGMRTEALEGLRWIYARPTMRAFAVGSHGWFLCSALAGAVLVPFALETVGLSAFGLGVALSAAGVGGLVGSLQSVRLGERFGAGRFVVACHASTSVAWALVSLGSHGWLLFGAGQLLLGLGMGASNANEMGYRQSVTPDHLQGRVNATMRSTNRAMIVVGAPLGGVLGDALGYRVVLMTAAVGFLAVAVGMGLSPFRRVRL